MSHTSKPFLEPAEAVTPGSATATPSGFGPAGAWCSDNGFAVLHVRSGPPVPSPLSAPPF